ncbi:type 1 glutamine amidotransferase [Oceaniserpentilla sp. 4NH20-0058]|uniref:glutamine amidotransferase-related protein n=1 Tax=Oceaniserpentilla sp. 4NH20-0058 TaxID=3127660 RepID=UPI0031071EDE
MKVGILAAGITPDELIGQFGSYANMFMELFKANGYTFEFEVFDVRDDVFPVSADFCDAWIITGSKSSVYQNFPWMVKLKSLILDIHLAQKPLIGICFGHQIIAMAFGGKVEKYVGGWGVGLHSYDVVAKTDFIPDAQCEFTINAIHQDQVIEKPLNADVIAQSDFCQYAGLLYDDQILTFQAHPEFSLEYEEALIESRKGPVVPVNIAEQGLISLRAQSAATESNKVAKWMGSFIEKRV